MFKDIRNIKRFQSYTINKDVMGSAKDLKNVRSTKLIDLTSFMDVCKSIFRTKTRK